MFRQMRVLYGVSAAMRNAAAMHADAVSACQPLVLVCQLTCRPSLHDAKLHHTVWMHACCILSCTAGLPTPAHGPRPATLAPSLCCSNGLLDPWSGGGVLYNLSEASDLVAVIIPEGELWA